MASLNDYSVLKLIGKGSYGEVHLVQHNKERKQYVIKKMVLQKASRRERKAAEQESKLLSELKHPNIVSYKDSFQSEDGFLYIVMGYAEGGDLYTRLRDQRERNDYLSEVQVVRWFIQICMALQYLHQQNILHRDLKTQNIFLTKTKMIKVGDLGIARVLDSGSDMATTLIGTPYYMSPELFSNRPYNHKSDVWALGCCVYEMTTLKHAFNAKDMNSLVYKILKNKMPKMPEIYSSELCDLIKGMLHQKAEKRPSVNKILRNPFIKKHIQLFLDESSRSRRPTSGRSRISTADTSSRRTSTSSVKSTSNSRESSTPVFEPAPPKPRISGVSLNEVNFIKKKESSYNKSRINPSTSDVKKDGILDLGAINAKKNLNRIYENIRNEKQQGYEYIVEKEDPYINFKVGELKNPAEVVDKLKKLKANDKDPNEILKKTQDDLDIPVRKVGEDEIFNEPRVRSAETKATDSMENSEKKKLTVSNQKRPLPLPRSNQISSEKNYPQKESLKSSSESNFSERAKVSSARERRRREKQKKADEMKEAVLSQPPHLVAEIPTTWKNSDRFTPPDKERRKDSSTAEEVDQFYTLLHTTLKLDNQEDSPPQTPPDQASGDSNSDVQNKLSPVEELSESAACSITERDGAAKATDPSYSRNTPKATEIVVHAPSNFNKPSNKPITQATLASTGRLMKRIVALRKECIRGLGVPLLHRAYELLDENLDEDQLEERLTTLLGQVRFKQWAGKIWQLKFCEESIFAHCGSITAY